MSLKPCEVYNLTHRELCLLMEADKDKKADEYQQQATYTMWLRAAYHSKKLKQTDLFDPTKLERNKRSRESFEELQAKVNEQQAFLDSLIIGDTAKNE